MIGPDRIFLGAENSDGEAEVWFDPDEGGTEYIRRAPAVLADLPEVQALIAEAWCEGRDAAATAAFKAKPLSFQQLEAIGGLTPPAAIRKRGEG